MKKCKQIFAVMLAVMIALSFSSQAFAKGKETEIKPYSSFAHIVDNLFGITHDVIFDVFMKLTKQDYIPSYEEYISQNNENFFEGTNGEVSGDGWSGGFAKGSIIPPQWRCNAEGKSDPNGKCLKILRGTGGYQTFVSKLYTDQMLNMIILSCGTDENRNGVEDILIFISIDGVGITAGTCGKIRSSICKSLKTCGVTADDILSCNISATHCHAGLDIQGMCIPTLFLNRFISDINPYYNYDRSLNKEMEENICLQAASCAGEAYGKIENGNLYFFETDKIDGCTDKLNCGVKTKNSFSCFLFEGISGEKTFITNIGSHPVSFDSFGNQMMCTDYPYFVSLALSDAGYNLVFTQSCQAAVGSPGVPKDYSKSKDAEAEEWVKSRALTKDEWIERYGKAYAALHYKNLENDLEGHMKKGYLIAHFIIDSVDKSLNLKPSLNIKNSKALLSLDYGIMAWGSVSGLLGENVVTSPKSETGYGVVVETNYLEFGGEVIVLTGPGELSPALVYGTDPDYNGTALWTGTTSWTGEDWQYDTIENMVLGKEENEGKKFVFMGITNDALGYMFPDICTPESLLGTLVFYKDAPGHNNEMFNEMLMTIGTSCGSELAQAYTALLDSFACE